MEVLKCKKSKVTSIKKLQFFSKFNLLQNVSDSLWNNFHVCLHYSIVGNSLEFDKFFDINLWNSSNWSYLKVNSAKQSWFDELFSILFTFYQKSEEFAWIWHFVSIFKVKIGFDWSIWLHSSLCLLGPPVKFMSCFDWPIRSFCHSNLTWIWQFDQSKQSGHFVNN